MRVYRASTCQLSLNVANKYPRGPAPNRRLSARLKTETAGVGTNVRDLEATIWIGMISRPSAVRSRLISR